jgi:DNA repair protein RadC
MTTCQIPRIRFQVVREPGPVEGQLKNATGVAEFLRRVIPDDGREHIACAYLDSQSVPVGFDVVFSGTVGECMAYPREIARQALLLNARSVLMGHNHPGGRVVASRDDIALTRKVGDALKLLGMEILDHVIVSHGKQEYYSLREMRDL